MWSCPIDCDVAGGNSSKQERITELSGPDLRVAGKPILVVYAQGVNNTDWGMTHIWQGAPYGNLTVDDVSALCSKRFISSEEHQIQYTKDIISDVSANYTVDATRRYACGKSNGGGFTALLACRPDTSKIFAAFAPVSPALYPATGAFGDCSPARPVPILHSHGIVDADTLFYGREPFPKACGFGPEPDVRDWRRDWAERNGCKRDENGALGPYTVEHPHLDTMEETWECGATVKALTMGHLGHAWPSTQGLDLAGFPNQTATFNFTTSHLLPFFSEQVLPQQYLD